MATRRRKQKEVRKKKTSFHRFSVSIIITRRNTQAAFRPIHHINKPTCAEDARASSLSNARFLRPSSRARKQRFIFVESCLRVTSSHPPSSPITAIPQGPRVETIIPGHCSGHYASLSSAGQM